MHGHDSNHTTEHRERRNGAVALAPNSMPRREVERSVDQGGNDRSGSGAGWQNECLLVESAYWHGRVRQKAFGGPGYAGARRDGI